MHIVWRPAADLSAWHTALAVAQGAKLVQGEAEAQLGERLAPCAAAGIPIEPALIQRLNACLAPAGDAADGAGSSESLAAVAAGFRALFPHAESELAMRSGPLIEQWESRGPGLWHALAKRTDAGIRSFETTVHLVLPVCGGGGAVHPDRSVRFEALLANPHASLPETVRLAWLLARAALAQQPADESTLALALVPAVLAAAEVVEWCRLDEATLTLALSAWRLAEEPAAPALAQCLAAWWEHDQAEGWPAAVLRLSTRLR